MPSTNLLLIVFVGVAALALLGQLLVLAGMARKLNEFSNRIAPLLPLVEDAAHKLPGLIHDLQGMVSETRPKLQTAAANFSEISSMARDQVQRADQFVSEFSARLQAQMVHVDEALNAAVNNFEQVSDTVRRTVLRPVQDASAIFQGVRTGLDFFFRRRSSPAPGAAHAVYQDEEMFI